MNLSPTNPDRHPRRHNDRHAPPRPSGHASLAAANPLPKHTPTSQPSDEQLLAQYSAGDRSSFAMLVQRYELELFHFLFRPIAEIKDGALVKGQDEFSRRWNR